MMASISQGLSLSIRCNTNQERKHKLLHSAKVNGTKTEEVGQNIQTRNQNRYPQGVIIGDDKDCSFGYRQTVAIRSNEVGPDKTATIESILYLLQETALNYMWMSGLQSSDDVFGTTRGMTENSLIWVLARMQLQVDHYPIWRDVMEIDTWNAASGKNGIRKDWILRNEASGLVFARATSTWVMISKQTRRLSKMPDEVRAEMSPLSIEKKAIDEGSSSEKIVKLDKALHMNSDLKPTWGDLDMNHHVNNVKYVIWMLETIPDEFLESHKLSGIILEYKRECGVSDAVQSLCEPADHVNGNLWASNDQLQAPKSYTHLLQKKGQTNNEEIVRGKTTWKEKSSYSPKQI